MNHLKESELKNLTHTLHKEKQELEHHFNLQKDDESGSLNQSLSDATGELSTYDNHPADVGTETFERGRDLALEEKMTNDLSQVNQALELIDQGRYGTCRICGMDIPFERLEALPYTMYCVDHTPRNQNSEDRPIEEEVMTPPPSGAGEKRQHNHGKFDDANAWESVEEYGTSNSAAMATKRDVKDYQEGM
ncbi:TraR/DksA C4-type zinc finger protein [Paenibacillus antarcticus]|uniref:Conjugal transfer protein TraR n=1 Tax=Paenibacillus antarcticus TaxID=253703 RepID=A0A168MSD7_9BACL|nr:TraR/DksA C4-type zinc finger protein [Paenibacillus antarcticus]OAB44995.1 conjugal transfer protein TraR [Paenibacillus antarcticus]